MTEKLYAIHGTHLDHIQPIANPQAVQALESGQIIFFPEYSFVPTVPEQRFLSESILHPKHKNLSYDITKHHVSGVNPMAEADLNTQLAKFMRRFAEYAKQLIDTTLPHYHNQLRWGRTSYRPAEIKGRKTSPRKDDTRIHVDAFPATPVNGQRILRVFCNVNPNAIPRVWETGELFPQALARFYHQLPKYNTALATLMHWFKATKSLRSHYDHMMLHLHDRMKLDLNYQRTTPKTRIDFPAMSTWIVYTDQVSHAALSGQHLLEQTFYLSVNAMHNPLQSPLRQWEVIQQQAYA